MTYYSPSLLGQYGSSDNWMYQELELDITDIDIIVAALWVAHRNTHGWGNHLESRVDELRRFFNQKHARFGQVTLWRPAIPDLPPEST